MDSQNANSDMLNFLAPYLHTLVADTSHTIVGLEPPVPYPYVNEKTISDHMPAYCSEFRDQNNKIAFLLAEGLEPEERYIIYRCSGGDPGMVCRLPNSDIGILVWLYADGSLGMKVVKFTETSYSIDGAYPSIILNTDIQVVHIMNKFHHLRMWDGLFRVEIINYVCMNCGGNGETCGCACEGCRMGHENQLGHMDPGGCLYDGDDDGDSETDEDSEIDGDDSGCEM